MKKHELTIGLNDKDLLKQIIPTENAIELIANYFECYKQAFTLSTTYGGYLMNNGKFTRETSVKIEILEFDENIELFIFNFIQYFLIEFNQESIAHAIYNIESDLVYMSDETRTILENE